MKAGAPTEPPLEACVPMAPWSTAAAQGECWTEQPTAPAGASASSSTAQVAAKSNGAHDTAASELLDSLRAGSGRSATFPFMRTIPARCRRVPYRAAWKFGALGTRLARRSSACGKFLGPCSSTPECTAWAL
ncbi:hypothetical protein OPT61_g8000 [Boeremia exigua]|uniref:Uncharacterized protein n=1 Tax=Boeremia exigua TaxID=749465 RepID=A0ACC2I0L7_9PLEO|nr:hypothetical protein OPT61_g8000 [Boeremia exigua]